MYSESNYAKRTRHEESYNSSEITLFLLRAVKFKFKNKKLFLKNDGISKLLEDHKKVLINNNWMKIDKFELTALGNEYCSLSVSPFFARFLLSCKQKGLAEYFFCFGFNIF